MSSAPLQKSMVPERLIEYFVTVGIGGVDGQIKAIKDRVMSEGFVRDFRIVSSKEVIGYDYKRMDITIGGRNACLMKKGMFQTGYYLCYSRHVNKLPVSSIELSQYQKENKDFERIKIPIPHQDDRPIFFDFSRDTENAPILDLCIIDTKAGELKPNNFELIEPCINDQFYICIRRAPEDQFGIRFESQILFRYPFEDHADNPLVQNLAIFCQPEGSLLRREQPLPTCLSFVLTDQEGKQMYGSAMTFYEEMKEEEKPPFRSALQTYCTIRVHSCGEVSVNGTYEPEGSHDGVPMFCKKVEPTEDANIFEDVVLFRQKSVENQKRYWWLIGRQLDHKSSSLVGQKDLYCVQSKGDIPPESGWMRLESAASPAPKIELLINDDHHNTISPGYVPEWKDDGVSIYQPKTVCLISRHGFFNTFRSCLTDLYRISMSYGQTPLERYIVNIVCETPLPVPHRFDVHLQFAHQPIIFHKPHDLGLPFCDVNLSIIFRYLGPEGVLKVWHALLLEQKIVIFSSNLSVITSVFESFTNLLFPFSWQYTYVPVLPVFMEGIEEAPMPVFVGMCKSHLKPEFFDDNKNLIVVDLDSGSVHFPKSVKIPEIPSSLSRQLLNDLINIGGVNTLRRFDETIIESLDCPFMASSILAFEDTCFDPKITRACFIRFFIRLLTPNFEKFLLTPNQMIDDYLFDIKAFLNQAPRNHKKFLNALFNTQAFMRFTDDLVFTGVTDSSRKKHLEFFKHCCRIEAEHNKDSQNPDIITFLSQDEMQLDIIKAPEINTDELPDGYEYSPNTGFSNLSEELFIEPRIPERNSFSKSLNHMSDVLSETTRARTISRGNRAEGMEDDLRESRDALRSVYGCWFSLQEAFIDKKTNLYPEVTVEEMLETLAALQFPRRKGGQLIPDELIYRSCLVICAKYKRDDDAKRIFKEIENNGIRASKETYGAYTCALASATMFNHVGNDIPSRRASSHHLGTPNISTTYRRSRSLNISRKQPATIVRHKSLEPQNAKPENLAEHDDFQLTIDESGDFMDETTTAPLKNPSTPPVRKTSPIAPEAVDDQIIPEIRAHSRSSSRSRSNSRGRLSSAVGSTPLVLPAIESREETQKINWNTIQIDNTTICDNDECGALLCDAHIMSGWDPNADPSDEEATQSKCLFCGYEFTPWLRIQYTYLEKNKEGEHVEKSQQVREKYLSPIVLRHELQQELEKHTLEMIHSVTFRENFASLFWNLLWYFHLVNLSADALLGKNKIPPRFTFFHWPTRCTYPHEDKILEECLEKIITALEKKDLATCIRLWKKYRGAEYKENLMRFKSVWSHSIWSGLEVLNTYCNVYNTQDKLREDFEEATTGLSLQDSVPPARVLAFRSTFHPMPLCYIPRLEEYVKQRDGTN